MEDQQDLFEEGPLIAAVEELNWDEVLDDPSGNLPRNEFFQFQPPQRYLKYYRLLRTMLNRQQKSKRCFTLTTLMLRLKPGNYYALMLRKDCLSQMVLKAQQVAKEVGFVNCLLALNPKEYQLWTYKKYILSNSALPLYELEIAFLDELLEQDSKNYHVWDYKLWLTTHYQRQQEQLQSTKCLLFEPPLHHNIEEQLQGSGLEVTAINWNNCYSLWSFRHNLIDLFYKQIPERTLIKREEIERVICWLAKTGNSNSECGWTYLIGIANSDCLDEATVQKTFDFGLLTREKEPNNRFAVNACFELGEVLSERFGKITESRKEILETLKSIDVIRKQYYEYLLSL